MKLLLVILFVATSLYFFSCQSNRSEKDASVSLTDSTSTSGITGDAVKLVKTAGINFKVKDVEKSSRFISGLAHKYGGMIYDQSFEATEDGRNELKISKDSIIVITNYTPKADITIRVPAEKLEEFMYAVADIGYFTASSRLNIDDKSIGYLENILKKSNRAEVVSTSKYTKGKSLSDLQTIEVKDEAIDQQTSNRIIDADVNYSAVHLNLYQNSLVRKEIIANYVTSDYQLSFTKRLSNALKDGWQYFLAFIIVLANRWMFILLTMIIIISYKIGQQKRRLNGFKLKT